MDYVGIPHKPLDGQSSNHGSFWVPERNKGRLRIVTREKGPKDREEPKSEDA